MAPSCCLPLICLALIQFSHLLSLSSFPPSSFFVPPRLFSFIAILHFHLLSPLCFGKPGPKEMLFRCVFTGLISQLPPCCDSSSCFYKPVPLLLCLYESLFSGARMTQKTTKQGKPPVDSTVSNDNILRRLWGI